MTRSRAGVVGLLVSALLFVVWYISLICWFGGRGAIFDFTCTSGNLFVGPIGAGLGGPPWRTGWHWRGPWSMQHNMGSAGWLPRFGSNLPGYAVQVPLWMPATVIGAISLVSWRHARRKLLKANRRAQLCSGLIVATAVVFGVAVLSFGMLYPSELIIFALGGFCFILIFSAPIGAVVGELWHETESPGSICQNCQYDLTGNVSGVCPECGQKVQRP